MLKKYFDMTQLLCGQAAAKYCFRIYPGSIWAFLKFDILIYTQEHMSKTAMIITEL